MDVPYFEDIYAHMEWADSTVWAATVEAQVGAIDERLRDTLLHMHLVQRGFLGLWVQSFDSPFDLSDLQPTVDPHDFQSATELRNWARSYYPLLREFLTRLDASELDGIVQFPNAAELEEGLGRPPDPVTLGETLYQVVAHSMHHRGQVNRRIRELDGEPPTIDYIAWLFKGRPAPVW